MSESQQKQPTELDPFEGQVMDLLDLEHKVIQVF